MVRADFLIGKKVREMRGAYCEISSEKSSCVSCKLLLFPGEPNNLGHAPIKGTQQFEEPICLLPGITGQQQRHLRLQNQAARICDLMRFISSPSLECWSLVSYKQKLEKDRRGRKAAHPPIAYAQMCIYIYIQTGPADCLGITWHSC